jgi:hypothetical protein
MHDGKFTGEATATISHCPLHIAAKEMLENIECMITLIRADAPRHTMLEAMKDLKKLVARAKPITPVKEAQCRHLK